MSNAKTALTWRQHVLQQTKRVFVVFSRRWRRCSVQMKLSVKPLRLNDSLGVNTEDWLILCIPLSLCWSKNKAPRWQWKYRLRRWDTWKYLTWFEKLPRYEYLDISWHVKDRSKVKESRTKGCVLNLLFLLSAALWERENSARLLQRLRWEMF